MSTSRTGDRSRAGGYGNRVVEDGTLEPEPKEEDDDDLEESQLWEFARAFLTSVLSDLAVVSEG